MKITIRALRPQGIWRAGKFHPAESIEHDAGDFSAEQLEQLRGEPLLLVTDGADETAAAEAPKRRKAEG